MKRFFIYSFQYTLVGNVSFGFGTASCYTEGIRPGLYDPAYPSYEHLNKVIREAGKDRLSESAILSIWEVSEQDFIDFNHKDSTPNQ